MVSSLTRHLYRHRRVTPSSCANSLTSSQVLRRSTAIRWNFREYRFRFTLQPFPCKVCPSWLSHFKGAVHYFIASVAYIVASRAIHLRLVLGLPFYLPDPSPYSHHSKSCRHRRSEKEVIQ